jgi:hypothetical protein
MKKIFCFLPALALIMALSGCCANNSCNCQDELADALLFSFQVGGTNGFAAAEIDTLIIVRITHPTAAYPTIVRDSVLRILPLTASGTDLKRDSIAINNASPFSLTGGNTKLSAYDYQLNASQVTAANGFRTTRRFSYTITNIKLDGRYNANGCCTCYLNTEKQFDISSRFLVATTDVRTFPARTTAVQTGATPAQTKVIAVNTSAPIPQTPTVTLLTR